MSDKDEAKVQEEIALPFTGEDLWNIRNEEAEPLGMSRFGSFPQNEATKALWDAVAGRINAIADQTGLGDKPSGREITERGPEPGTSVTTRFHKTALERLASVETDLADVRERVMGHQPLMNAADLVDAAHKRLNETQQRVADLEEWKARTERVPGTGPALPDDGRVTHVPTAWQVDAEIADDTPGAALYADYRHLVGRHGFQSPPWNKTGDWEREWWEGLAGEYCSESELRAQSQRQATTIAKVCAERNEATRKLDSMTQDRDEMRQKYDAARENRDENHRVAQARIGELERERDEALARVRELKARAKERRKELLGRISNLEMQLATCRDSEGRHKRLAESGSRAADKCLSEARMVVRAASKLQQRIDELEAKEDAA